MKENIELEADEDRRSIKISVKGEVPEGMPVHELVQGEEMLKQMTSVFIGEKIDFALEQLPDANGVLLQFDDEE